MNEHASEVVPLNFARVIEALEEALDADGSLTIVGENGAPLLVLRDASVHETGAVGWVQ